MNRNENTRPIIKISRTTYERLGKYARGYFQRTGTQNSDGTVSIIVETDVLNRLNELRQGKETFDSVILRMMNAWDRGENK